MSIIENLLSLQERTEEALTKSNVIFNSIGKLTPLQRTNIINIINIRNTLSEVVSTYNEIFNNEFFAMTKDELIEMFEKFEEEFLTYMNDSFYFDDGDLKNRHSLKLVMREKFNNVLLKYTSLIDTEKVEEEN